MYNKMHLISVLSCSFLIAGSQLAITENGKGFAKAFCTASLGFNSVLICIEETKRGLKGSPNIDMRLITGLHTAAFSIIPVADK